MGPQGPPGEPSDPFNRRVCGGATKRSDEQPAIAAIVATAEPVDSAAKHVLSKRGVEPYIGEIALYPYSFCPRGWLYCNGQLLQIASNTALCELRRPYTSEVQLKPCLFAVALIGAEYGGDGRLTFAVPDMRPFTPNPGGSCRMR